MSRTEVTQAVTTVRLAAFQARIRAKLSCGQLPLVEQLLDAGYLLRRGCYTAPLPPLPADSLDVVQELRQDGVTHRSVYLPEAVETAADRMVENLRCVTTPMSRLRIPIEAHAADPTVFKWGLAPENLDLAESYIGLPARYLGVELKRERPGGADPEMIRRWHMDIEDHRMLKIIVYLSDVDQGAGPFEYLKRQRTIEVIRALNYRNRYQLGYAIDHVVCDRVGEQVTGPRLTAVYADTGRILHRAKPPKTKDRYSLTFLYSSMKPRHVCPQYVLPDQSLRSIRDELSTRQRRALQID